MEDDPAAFSYNHEYELECNYLMGELTLQPLSNTNTIHLEIPMPPPPSSSCLISFQTPNFHPPSLQWKVETCSSNENSLKPEPFFEVPNTFSWQGSNKKDIGEPSRSPVQALDHAFAERERRAMLNQRFIALSAVIPGLKKKDKASILEEATKYLKQLQEQVKFLEEQASAKKTTMESVVILKKSQVFVDDDSFSTGENSDGCLRDQALPEIEARVSDRDVLIRIHCENHKGCLLNILSEIEKLHLSMVNSNVLPLGNSTVDITIVAKMDDDFCITMEDLVKKLRQALLKFLPNFTI